MQRIIPLWVVASIGKQIRIKKPHNDGVRTYPAGSLGTLAGILHQDQDPSRFYAIVSLDRNDPSDLENFDFRQLMPVVETVSFSLNIERGLIAF